MILRLTTSALVLLAGVAVPRHLAAQVQSTEPAGPDTVVFTPSRGTVTFTHKKHAELSECVSCHHESRPEKPLASPRQKCSGCHTNPATEPMKTSLRAAFHDTVAKEGTCYSCHNKEAAAGKTVPQACADCHKREG